MIVIFLVILALCSCTTTKVIEKPVELNNTTCTIKNNVNKVEYTWHTTDSIFFLLNADGDTTGVREKHYDYKYKYECDTITRDSFIYKEKPVYIKNTITKTKIPNWMIITCAISSALCIILILVLITLKK